MKIKFNLSLSALTTSTSASASASASIASLAFSLFSLLFFLTPHTASAEAFETGAVASSMGGAGRGAADASESSLLNPASLVHVRQYHVSALGATSNGHWGNPELSKSITYGVILADGGPDKLAPGAFHYLRRESTFENGAKQVEQDFEFALATFIYPKVGLGIAGHYQTDKQQNIKIDQFNAHVGLIWNPVAFFAIGGTIYNAIAASPSVREEIRLTPTYALGLHGLYEDMLRVRLDFVRPTMYNNPLKRTDVQFGVETFFRDDFIFRAGWQWKETRNMGIWSLGLGYKGPRLSLDYTFQTETRHIKLREGTGPQDQDVVNTGTRHMIDLWLPI